MAFDLLRGARVGCVRVGMTVGHVCSHSAFLGAECAIARSVNPLRITNKRLVFFAGDARPTQISLRQNSFAFVAAIFELRRAKNAIRTPRLLNC